MKKIYKLAFAMLLGTQMIAQTPFYEPTDYRGAFAPAPTPMWTDGWCDWDPQNTVHPAPTVTVTSNITSNTTWTASNTYLIQGLIYVTNGATLTIEAGTTVLGDKNIANSSLIITQGAKLMAQGTSSQPIVFSSNQTPGNRSLGDWGGIILLGNAQINADGDTSNVEGIAPSALTRFGGGANPDDNDNTGTLQYIRIEFGGYIFQPNKEINGLTLGGIGRGTTIDHIQVSFSNDDSYEWFGGTVNCKYLVSYRSLDDDFDTDFGYHGHVQFGLSVRDPDIADDPAVSTSEGFESDNDPNGTAATPLTATIFSNMTLVGPLRGDVSTASSIAVGYRRGARIRRNSNLKIANTILMDHVRGVHIDGTACESNATSGALAFTHNIVAGNTIGKVCEVNTGSTFDIHSWFGTTNPYGVNDSLISTTGILTTPYDYLNPDYRPAASSPALTGASFADPFFTGWMMTGVKENTAAVQNIGVYPNPAADNAHIMVNMLSSENVSITVTDVTGRVVANVYNNENLSAGSHNISLNTTTFTNGLYFVTVSANNAVQTIKLVINK